MKIFMSVLLHQPQPFTSIEAFCLLMLLEVIAFELQTDVPQNQEY